jgi:oxygen-independent coproporphyrinogen-3 oxidase
VRGHQPPIADPCLSAADNVSLLDACRPVTVAGLYLHVPFCFHKCHYCDFYSIVDDRDRQAAFAERMVAELDAVAPRLGSTHKTIFVGGGTPTLLAPEHWRKLLNVLAQRFDLTELSEFTVEANPETVTAELLDVLVAGGVNRLSIGCQSFDPTHLKTLERWHEPASVTRSVQLARAAGIENFNLDLIFAIPGQTLDEWQADLDAAVALSPTHLSCYSLMFEPNTPLTQKLKLGRIVRADEDLEAAMFRRTIDTLAAAGYEHYEISNWAKRDQSGGPSPYRCEHNLQYWRSENWFAIGPSASGHLDGVRWKNLPHLGRYLAAGPGTPIVDVERLDPAAQTGERLMMYLRLLDGVPQDWLNAHLDADRRRVLHDLIGRDLLESTRSAVRLTRRGLMLADSIVAELL